MAGATNVPRAETRKSMSVFVELFSFDNSTYEITDTIDVSPHGARVLSKTPWAPNQRVSIRALGGHLESQARVVYCEQLAQQYVVGLELQHPTGEWLTQKKALRA